ncbi:MAG: hypothetical protein ACI9LD_000538 [Polaromonas sp.]
MQLRQQLVRQQEQLRQLLVPLEPQRQQLVLAQQLELGLQLGLLFYRKRPRRKLRR